MSAHPIEVKSGKDGEILYTLIIMQSYDVLLNKHIPHGSLVFSELDSLKSRLNPPQIDSGIVLRQAKRQADYLSTTS